MKKKEEHPWIKFKKYPHIGFPLERKDTSKLEGYIMDENKIANHSFLPFLHRTIFQRKFRANYILLVILILKFIPITATYFPKNIRIYLKLKVSINLS